MFEYARKNEVRVKGGQEQARDQSSLERRGRFATEGSTTYICIYIYKKVKWTNRKRTTITDPVIRNRSN